ncbi:MAG: SGNH/GDSL hydrolase family protein [Chloroflexi bacterium]|nr:SGNH/GDSL hydrolase family protein [Chloroflexota bacterium]
MSLSASIRRLPRRLLIALAAIALTLLTLEVALRLFYSALPGNLPYVIRHVRLTPFSERRLVDLPNTPEVARDPFAAWLTWDSRYGRRVKPVRDLPVQLSSSVQFKLTTYAWSETGVAFRTPPEQRVAAVALGDSMTFCWTALEDCWVTLLSQELELPIANLGVPGTGSLSRARVYADFAQTHAPKLVLWQFLLNDHFEDYRDARALQRSSDDLDAWLDNHSAFYALAKRLIERIRRTDPTPQTTDLNLVTERGITLNVASEWLKAWDESAYAEGRQLGLAAIRETQAAVQRHGGTFVLLILPTAEELYREIFERHAAGEPSAGLARLEKARAELRAFCEQVQLICFDAYDALRAQAYAQALIYPDDKHFNAAGNRLLAQAIAIFLKENRLASCGD